MTEVLQAIADVDCANAFLRFDSETVKTLRRYHELCAAVGESKFFSHGVTFRFSAQAGQQPREELDHAGHEALRSLMMDLRQLWMQGERTRFQTVLGILRRNAMALGSVASAEAISQLDGIGKRYRKSMRKTTMSFVERERPLVPVKEFSAEDVIHSWLYGGNFHWDEEKAAFIDVWRPESYEFTLSKAIHAASDSFWELDLLIQAILQHPRLVEEDPAP